MIEFIIYAALGVGLACFFFWLRDRFHLIIYKIDNITERETLRRTTVVGDDTDTDEDDVRGSIGFKGAEK